MKELINIQSELKAPKNQYNSFGNFNYRSAEDILESVKPLLYAQKCTLTISDEMVEVGGRIYVKATATLKSETEEIKTSAFAREEEMKKGMDAAQITGSASSYARKYALNGLFCIDDTKDPDATNNGKEVKEQTGALLEKALKEAKESKTRMELDAIWKKYVALQKDTSFLDTIKEMSQKYPR